MESSAPPEITDLEIKGEVDPRQEEYANKFDERLQAIEEGKSREAEIMRSQMEGDMERQIASAREAALASGQPFTAEDESRMRAELKRGQYGAMAEFELGSQRQSAELQIGGAEIAKMPWASQMAEKGLSAQTQQMLMDYALGRGGLISEDKRTAVQEAGLAIDAYKAMISMLSGGGGSFDFSTNYG